MDCINIQACRRLCSSFPTYYYWVAEVIDCWWNMSYVYSWVSYMFYITMGKQAKATHLSGWGKPFLELCSIAVFRRSINIYFWCTMKVKWWKWTSKPELMSWCRTNSWPSVVMLDWLLATAQWRVALGLQHAIVRTFLMDHAVAPALYPLSILHIFTPPLQKKERKFARDFFFLLKSSHYCTFSCSFAFHYTFPAV